MKIFKHCIEIVDQVLISVAKGSIVWWLQEPRYHLRSWVRLSTGVNILGFNGVVH